MFVCKCVLFRYRTFVSEDAGPNTLVATVLAKDPDGDGITYKISAGNEEGNFIIDSQKGEPSLPCYFNFLSFQITDHSYAKHTFSTIYLSVTIVLLP